MSSSDYYQVEKLGVARRCLMLPVADPVMALAGAFHECDLALGSVDKDSFEGHPAELISVIEDAIDCSGLQDPEGRGLYNVKAALMSEEDILRFSDAVDSLATWFERQTAR